MEDDLIDIKELESSSYEYPKRLAPSQWKQGRPVDPGWNKENSWMTWDGKD